MTSGARKPYCAVLQEAPEEGWGNVWWDIEESLVDQQSDMLNVVLEQLRELRVL